MASSHKTKSSFPVCLSPVQAGFPSAGESEVEEFLDLNSLVIKHPEATFFVRAEGDSMKGAGIHTGDILVVDRSIPPSNGKIVIAVVSGEFTVKRLNTQTEIPTLVAENEAYPPIPLNPEDETQIWGVVTFVIHQVHP